MPEFCEAFRFATGTGPPSSLLSVTCEGTVARRRVRRLRDFNEESFIMCTRHADLLWLLGYVELEGYQPRPPGPGPQPGGGAPGPTDRDPSPPPGHEGARWYILSRLRVPSLFSSLTVPECWSP
jgi:hypothetical protein